MKTPKMSFLSVISEKYEIMTRKQFNFILSRVKTENLPCDFSINGERPMSTSLCKQIILSSLPLNKKYAVSIRQCRYGRHSRRCW